MSSLPAASARALPVLRLFLHGDARTLGRGGAEVFHDHTRELLELRRPALIGPADRGFVALSFDHQSIVSIGAGEWAGTRASDRILRLTAAIPVGEVVGGVSVIPFVSVRHEAGTTHLQRRTAGTLLHFDEDRTLAALGAAAQLPYGLSLSASAEPSSFGQPGYAAAVAVRPLEGVSLWYERRQSDTRYRLRVPEGVAARFDTPALEYEIDAARLDDELGAHVQLARGVLHARATMLAGEPENHAVEIGGRPLKRLLLRARRDARTSRFSDFMRAAGTGTIATVDLGLREEHLSAGADLDLGRRAGALHGRYVHTRLTGASRAAGVGTATAHALLDVDLDLGLLFQGDYAVAGHQVALGWDAISLGGRFEGGLGGQFLRLYFQRGDYRISSGTLRQSLAAAELGDARVDVLGLTGQLAFRPGPFTFSLAAGQLVPVGFDDGSPPERPGAGGGGGGSGGGGGGGGGGGSGAGGGDDGGPFGALSRTLDRITSALDRYGGGTLVLLRASMSF